MKSARIGFVGTGNMGGAMASGVAAGQLVKAEQLVYFDPDTAKCAALKAKYGGYIAQNLAELVTDADIIFLAVKPVYMEKVLKDIAHLNVKGKVFVSLAVGIPISFYKEHLGADSKIIRTMPNTPALIGEGMTLACHDDNTTKEEFEYVLTLLRATGKAEPMAESMITAVTGVSGSSPAYVYMFIEALADGAVLSGIPRDQAYRLAAQTVLGSARMVLESGMHPGTLKDQVCSPAGTTIEAVSELEKRGFRAAVIEAVRVCNHKAVEIGKAFGVRK